MKKALLFFAYILIFLLSLSGCSNTVLNNPVLAERSSEMNEMVAIYDNGENLLANIEHFGAITQTDSGFVYSKLSSGSTNGLYSMEYYQYDFATNESEKLGSIEEWVYEASYDSIYHDNHVYLLVTTGNAYDFDETENYLCDIDLVDKTITSTMLENATSPYNSMTLAQNEIIIVTPGNERCYINSYDIDNQMLSRVSEYWFDSETNTGETIRHISSDEQHIFLLRLYMEGLTNVKLYVDVYDLNMTPLSSIEVTQEIMANIKGIEDENNELRQLVSQFDVNKGFVYYENFSITRALFELQNMNFSDIGDIRPKHVVTASPAFFKAVNAVCHDTLSIYYEFYQNKIFVMDANERKMQEYSFFAKDKNYCITYVTNNSKGDMLIFVDYSNPDSSKILPRRIYFINLLDLIKQ